MTGYLLGKKFKHLRWLKYLIEHEDHQKKWDIFDRRIAIIVIFGKLIPFVRSAPSFFAGVRNIPTKKYALLSIVGFLLWSLLGIYGGSLLSLTLGNWAIPIILGILVLTGFIALLNRFVKMRKNRGR